MKFSDLRRHRAAHKQPHDNFAAFPSAQSSVFGGGDVAEPFRILFETLHEFHIPWSVVEPGAFAMNLMREAACRDDRDFQVFRITEDCFPERFTKLVATSRS